MLLNSVRIACLAFAAASIATTQSLSPDFFRDLRWRCIGPFRGGRTRAATGVPGQPNLFYMGQVNSNFPDGKMHVTCYTCHRGETEPKTEPGAAAEPKHEHKH